MSTEISIHRIRAQIVMACDVGVECNRVDLSTAEQWEKQMANIALIELEGLWLNRWVVVTNVEAWLQVVLLREMMSNRAVTSSTTDSRQYCMVIIWKR